ncbi:MAG: ROK family protein [Clostridiales bacterium]
MYVGVDIKETEVAIGLVSEGGKVAFHSFLPVAPEKDPDTIVMEIIFIIKSLAETVPLELFNDRIQGIGIAIADDIDKSSGSIIGQVRLRLPNDSHREKLERHFNLPVYIDNRGAAAALAGNEIKDFQGIFSGIIAAALLCKFFHSPKEEFAL